MAAIEAIATTYLEADATSVTFSSLGSYEHLQIRASLKTSRAASVHDALRVTFNSDTGNNYSYHWMMGDSTNETAGHLAGGRLDLQQFTAEGTTTPASEFCTTIVDILDYRNASKNTSVMYACGFGGASFPRVTFGDGLWDDTAAVTSIILDQESSPNFVRGSVFTLYGLNSS